jgi:hypothetical protein
MRHWLITYQQNNSRQQPLVANCVTSRSPGEWLFDTLGEEAGTILLSAVEITAKEKEQLSRRL